MLQPTSYNLQANKGFSLLELIIYVAIFSTVSAVFIAALINLTAAGTRSKVTTDVQQNLRAAVSAIAQSARGASAITFPAPGASATSTTMLVNGQTVRYSTTTAGVLQKQTESNPPENITTDSVKVTSLNFTTVQNTAVSNSAVAATSTQIAITVEYNATGAQFQYSQSATTTERLAVSF